MNSICAALGISQLRRLKKFLVRQIYKDICQIFKNSKILKSYLMVIIKKLVLDECNIFKLLNFKQTYNLI